MCDEHEATSTGTREAFDGGGEALREDWDGGNGSARDGRLVETVGVQVGKEFCPARLANGKMHAV